MQPAQSSGTNGSSGRSRQLKRWGPIVGVVAVVAIGAVVIVATSGGDDDHQVTTIDPTVATPASSAPVTTVPSSAPATTAEDTSEPSAPTSEPAPEGITYPLSFPDAQEMGIADQIDWGERCDTTTGQLAVPDYFAQPCMAPFTGDNGGATDTGVTADEITIVYYEGQEADPIIAYITDAIAVDETNEQQFETMRHIVDYYETYFELYGRHVNLVTFEGSGGAADDVAARADAARIAEEYQPFVVFNGPALTSAFADELAAREVMCISCTPGQPTQFYRDRDPYVWGLDGSEAQKQSHAVELITKQLVGKNATHAGAQFVDQPRKFGLLYLDSSAGAKDLADAFAASMDAAGAPLAEVIAYALDPATIQSTASQVISKMKSAGVTTIVFHGDPVAPRDFTKEATAQEYFPEWVLSGSVLVDTNAFARTYDQEQWAHAFGVTQLAAKVDPETIGYYAIYKWFNGVPPETPANIAVNQPAPALFFAVAQGVGPNLTHETWKDALFAAGGTRAAISQPFLSWGDGLWPETDYLGLDDATAIWWDPTATGPDEIRKEGTGMYRFVDGGKRYLPGEWPTDDRMFVPDGAVAIYDTPPPGEAPPSYPSPAGG
ncbi:MAG: hypothetical protein AB7L17_20590 [Ilumatobacteraceae bacterium]